MLCGDTADLLFCKTDLMIQRRFPCVSAVQTVLNLEIVIIILGIHNNLAGIFSIKRERSKVHFTASQQLTCNLAACTGLQDLLICCFYSLIQSLCFQHINLYDIIVAQIWLNHS